MSGGAVAPSAGLRREGGLIAWLVVVALLVSAAGARAAAESVLSVELRSTAEVQERAQVWGAVAIEVGQMLRSEDVRQTLMNLQALSFVGAAEVLATRRDGGLDVLVVIAPKLTVESVELEGDLCLRRSLLEGRLLQKESTPLGESRLLRGVYRLYETLEEAGFDEAVIQLRVEVDHENSRAAIRYVVECGSPLLIEEIRIDGDLGPFAASELKQHMQLDVGSRLRRDRMREAAERLQKWLLESGYAAARVEKPVVGLGSDPRRAVLEVTVDVGPRLEVSVIGVEKAALDKHGLLDLLRSERLDDALLQQVVAGIRRFYQQRGHYEVRVDSRRHESPGAVDLEIVVDQGQVFTIRSVTFAGNERLKSDQLASRIATGPKRALTRGSGRLVDFELEEDLRNLRSYYALQGFADARVGPAAITVDGSDLAIELPIVEGDRRRVVDIQFAGVESERIRASLPSLSLVPGGPYHPRLLEEMLDELRARYEEAGYLSAHVEAQVEEAREATRVSVAVSVNEGPLVRVGRILVRGNARTRTGVVSRAVRISSGDVASRRSLLDAQRRLYQLGIFTRAEVRLVPGMPYSSRRDVLVRVSEGRPARGTLGLGYDSEDGVRGLVGYSHGNLGGRAFSMRVETRVSEREWQFRTLVRQPSLGSYPIPVTYSLFAVEEDRESFESRRRGLQVEGHRLWGASRLGLLYSYRIVEVLENPDLPVFRLDLERNLREAKISSVTPSLLLDYRDDPLLPTEGWTLSLQSELAFPVGIADARFIKMFGQHSHYVPLGRLGVVAGSLRLGAIEALDVDESDPGSLVPISEQFFAGGRTTHRAYRRDLLGIPGETVFLCQRETDECVGELPPGSLVTDYRRLPVGGNGVLLANLDYRFPLAGPVGGTVFADAGNVWADWRDIDVEHIKLGVGLGLRYLSPVGPLRFEVGWKLDREPAESSPVLFLSFGNPF